MISSKSFISCQRQRKYTNAIVIQSVCPPIYRCCLCTENSSLSLWTRYFLGHQKKIKFFQGSDFLLENRPLRKFVDLFFEFRYAPRKINIFVIFRDFCSFFISDVGLKGVGQGGIWVSCIAVGWAGPGWMGEVGPFFRNFFLSEFFFYRNHFFFFFFLSSVHFFRNSSFFGSNKSGLKKKMLFGFITPTG